MIIDRPMQDERDWWAIRELISELHRSGPPGLSWEVRRWDGLRYHRKDHARFVEDWQDRVHLWWEQDTLVGVAHPEGAGEACFQVRPEYRHLQSEMLDWATEHLTHAGALTVLCMDHDAHLRRLLGARGFVDGGWGAVARVMALSAKPPTPPEIAPGYRIRSTTASDVDGVAALIASAFGRDSDISDDLAAFRRHAPCFVGDWDLVAETEGGTLAAYVGLSWDPQADVGIFEPVCTHPNFQRRGLAKALMHRGIALLHSKGVGRACVDSGDPAAANALYESVGFTEAYHGRAYEKRSPGPT